MDNIPRIGRIAQLGGLGIIVVYFVATAATAPALHDSTDETAPGRVTVSAMGAAWDGSVTQYAANGTQLWQHTGAGSYNGIQQVGEDRWLVSYTVHDVQDCGQFDSPCARTGVRIINRSGSETTVAWQWDQPVRDGRNSEVHDAEVLPNGNVVIADMDRERILVVNRSTKAVEWEWRASSHYQAPADPTTVDWLHINDVDHLGNGQFLVSVRNANQLLIVERGVGVVEVINEDQGSPDGNCLSSKQLGASGAEDVKCGSTKVLNHQHNPQWLGDGAVLVADSENDRVVELHKENGEWTVYWAITSANQVPFDWPRDADRLPNGNTLITDTRNARVVEVTANGTVTWSRSVPEQAYDADVNGSEYPAGPTTETSQTVGVSHRQPLVFVDQLYDAIRWAVPLPYWVTSWHVLVTLIGGFLAVYGTLARQVASREATDDSPEEVPTDD